MPTFADDVKATEHDYYTPERMEGVSGCRRCGGFEGSLPTHCPGESMTLEQQDAVYADTLDFLRGKWRRTLGEDPDYVINLEEYRELAFAVCQHRGWDQESRTARLGFNVLEAAELTEALRGKGGNPIEEAGDVLFTSLVMIPMTISLGEVIRFGRKKMADLMTKPPYQGEERT